MAPVVMKVTSSYGHFLINLKSGHVLERNLSNTHNDYEKIMRFDVTEWVGALVENDVTDRLMAGEVDICHIGYWHADGFYEHPAYAFRDESFELGKQYRRERVAKQEQAASGLPTAVGFMARACSSSHNRANLFDNLYDTFRAELEPMTPKAAALLQQFRLALVREFDRDDLLVHVALQGTLTVPLGTKMEDDCQLYLPDGSEYVPIIALLNLATREIHTYSNPPVASAITVDYTDMNFVN